MSQPINHSSQSKRQRTNLSEPFTPWHKEPWVWFIFGLLFVAIGRGGFQVYTAFTHRDSVVVDDYYKYGKAINQDMGRINRANQLNIRADILIDGLIGEVRVKVNGDLENWPEQLGLSFLSPAFADEDEQVNLQRTVSGDYVGQLSRALNGRYYLQLDTQDQKLPEQGYQTGWRITMEAQVTPDQLIHLKNPESL